MMTRFHAGSLIVAMTVLCFAGAATATEMDDYHLYVQAGLPDFFHGEFKETRVDQDRSSILLRRLDNSPEYAREGEYVSPECKAERPFDALFVSWTDACEGADRIEVFVRVGDTKKNYTEWFAMARETDRVFASNYEYLQYKVRLTSGSGRTTPEFRSIAFRYTDLYDQMKNLNPEPVDYALTLAAPAIVEREDWGAVKPSSAYSTQTPKAIILHHSWMPNASQYTGAATIKGIQNYHMTDPKTGWIDIGYHFLIGPDGKIYRGRPETALGSHCIPNTDKIGICCIGDHDPGKDPLTPATYAALKKLIPHLASKYKISKVELYGHRDFSTKTCPGDTVYVKIPELKNIMTKVLGK